MKITKIKKSSSRTTNKVIVVAVIVFIICGLSAAVFFFTRGQAPDATQSNDASELFETPATQEEINTGSSVKEDVINSDNGPGDDGSISASTVVDSSQVRILVQISKILSEGTCSLKLINKATSIEEPPVDIQALPGYTTCKGWVVPVSKLSPGNWTAQITVTSPSVTGSTTTEFNI